MMSLSSGFAIALHEIAPARLAELIEGLPGRPVPLDELVERKKAGKSNTGLFAITVDDGVRDNTRGLAQLFLARQWPATFFLPTEYIDTGRPMAFQWWWRLKPLLPRRKLRLSSGVLDLSRPGALDELARKVEGLWYYGRRESYLPLTMDLASAVAENIGATLDELEGPPPIAWGEVEQLSRNDLLQFESHGVSHAAMSGLSEEELDFEMRHSRETLEAHTGRPCRHLCYPFGSDLSIGAIAPKLARRYYDSALTTSRGSLDRADAWMLPRIALYPTTSRLCALTKIILSGADFRARTAEQGSVLCRNS
jgi:peptidoglycan/xylan/chitin deacetylase (PgdA/CDA1 family)